MENLGVNDSLVRKLPNECLAHIFSFLPILERLEAEKVCKRWRTISKRGWNDIKELKIEEEYSDNTIHLILKRCGRFLKKLEIWDSLNQFICLSKVIEFCRLDQLEEIQILMEDRYVGGRKLERNIRNIREIFEKNRNLVAVRISADLSYYGMDYLNFLNSKTLRKLDIEDRREVSSIDPDRFPNLQKLRLCGIEIIEDETKRERDSLKGLEKLNMYRCYVPQNFIQRIGTFTNLQELDLELIHCNIKNEHIRHIAEHCDKIKKMSLTYSPEITITSKCFQYLGKMPSLEVLNFEYLDNINSRDIPHLKNVKKLSFLLCDDIIGGDGLIELIVKSSSLEELQLDWIKALSRSFLDNVRRIYHSGQREKMLIFIVKGPAKERLDGLGEVTDHPLLDLRIDIEVDSDNERSIDYGDSDVADFIDNDEDNSGSDSEDDSEND